MVERESTAMMIPPWKTKPRVVVPWANLMPFSVVYLSFFLNFKNPLGYETKLLVCLRKIFQIQNQY